MQERTDIFFLSSSQMPEFQTSYSCAGTLLCYSLYWLFPLSFSHALPLFSIIYTFKHEISLIHCEFSQYDIYQCDNQNMSLSGLVAPRLEFHFITWHSFFSFCLFFSSASLSLFPPVVNLSSCCVHFWSLNLPNKRSWIDVLRGSCLHWLTVDMHCCSSQYVQKHFFFKITFV